MVLAVLLAVLLSATDAVSVSISDYPSFKQCDVRWGSDVMGIVGVGHRATICQEGCAMTCLSMVLAGRKLWEPPAGGNVTPGTLNQYLAAHGEYRCDSGDCDNLVLTAADDLTGGRMRLVGEWAIGSISTNLLVDGLAANDIAFIAHVANLHHFVLLREFDPKADTFAVLDPLYSTQTYSRANISDILM
jgi:hypothetical protein